MKRENRLRKNHDFQRVINSKKSIVSKYLVVYYLPNDKKKLRIGISVSKKFINAVGRNKVRRQVRSTLDNIKMFDKEFDVVLIIRKPFMSVDFNLKQKSLQNILKKV